MIQFLEEFIWLIFAHGIGDAGLQTDWMTQGKTFNGITMVSHAVVYSACVSVALKYIKRYDLSKAILLFSSHILIDYLTITLNFLEMSRICGPGLDQSLHLIVLIIVFWRFNE